MLKFASLAAAGMMLAAPAFAHVGVVIEPLIPVVPVPPQVYAAPAPPAYYPPPYYPGYGVPVGEWGWWDYGHHWHHGCDHRYRCYRR